MDQLETLVNLIKSYDFNINFSDYLKLIKDFFRNIEFEKVILNKYDLFISMLEDVLKHKYKIKNKNIYYILVVMVILALTPRKKLKYIFGIIGNFSLTLSLIYLIKNIDDELSSYNIFLEDNTLVINNDLGSIKILRHRVEGGLDGTVI